jgi:hypothetical protein
MAATPRSEGWQPRKRPPSRKGWQPEVAILCQGWQPEAAIPQWMAARGSHPLSRVGSQRPPSRKGWQPEVAILCQGWQPRRPAAVEGNECEKESRVGAAFECLH